MTIIMKIIPVDFKWSPYTDQELIGHQLYLSVLDNIVVLRPDTVTCLMYFVLFICCFDGWCLSFIFFRSISRYSRFFIVHIYTTKISKRHWQKLNSLPGVWNSYKCLLMKIVHDKTHLQLGMLGNMTSSCF